MLTRLAQAHYLSVTEETQSPGETVRQTAVRKTRSITENGTSKGAVSPVLLFARQP